MSLKNLYLYYGISLGALGLVGFVLTHAKSALISGLASAAIMVALSFFVEKVTMWCFSYNKTKNIAHILFSKFIIVSFSL